MNQMMAWRHHLHKNPETAFGEIKTAEFVALLLESWGYEVCTGVGKTGVVASLRSGQGRKAIGLRADMDALPVSEQVESEYKSRIAGKMHACGHDGHIAMLLGAAQYLSEKRDFNGTVRLIFQPAEEIMGGAPAMIKDRFFERFPVDAIFGLHNMPGVEQGKLYFRSGPMMAAVDNWEVELTGRGSHGSVPEKSLDPIVAGSSLVMALQTIVSRNVAPLQSAVVSVGAFLAGEAANVIPQSAILRLSIRSSTQTTRDLVLNRVKAVIAAQAQSFGVSYEVREGPPGAILVNDAVQTAFAAQVAKDLLGEDQVSTEGATYMGSEDFAVFTEQKPGTYCIIGNGDTPMVHNPTYVFEDKNLTIGCAYWIALTEAFLK
jgi:hippurate hydrolase